MVLLQYEAKDTVLHRMHPLPKLLWIFAMAIICSIFYNPFVLLFFLAIDLVLILFARIPWRGWLNQIITVAMFSWIGFFLLGMWQTSAERWVHLDPDFATTVILAVTPVGTPIFGRMDITYGGLLYTAGMSIRVLVLLFAFCVFIYSTSPEEFVCLLRKFHIPAKLTFIVMATYRFFPDILNKLGTIRDAQSLRGWNPRSLNPIKVIREYMPLAVPAMTELVHMSTSIALSAEAKGFGNPHFIILHELELGKSGILLIVSVLLVFLITMYLYITYRIGIL